MIAAFGRICALWLLCLGTTPGAAEEAAAKAVQPCTYGCDDCKGKSSWYKLDADGKCTERDETKQPTFFAVSHNCILDDQKIRDNKSCHEIVEQSKWKVLYGKVFVNFDDENGCTINDASSSILEKMDVSRFRSELCFGQINWWVVIGVISSALLTGVIIGVITHFAGHSVKSQAVDLAREFPEVVYGPGSRRVAMHNIVDKSRSNYVYFYRVCQVIANCWLPMVTLWTVSAYIVVPLWFVLYVCPQFYVVGLQNLIQPQNWVSPAHISLLGIGRGQVLKGEHGHLSYLYSIFRPFIFVGMALAIARLISHSFDMQGYSEHYAGNIVANPVAFWRAGLECYWGDIVLYFTYIATAVGTSLHIILTLPPVIRAFVGSSADGAVTLEGDEDLREEILNLADKVCDAAVKDDIDDQDRVNDLGVEVMSHTEAYFLVGCAIADFGAYFYKIIKFLKETRYPLAFFMAVALAEAVTGLYLGGDVRKARADFPRVVQTGIPTVHFLQALGWDDGLVGIPCLLLTVYGLPLVHISNVVTCATSILFICTGTRALAIWLHDTCDSDMYGMSDALAVRLGVVDKGDEDSIADDDMRYQTELIDDGYM